MHCPSCKFENEPGAQFCEECGRKLVSACPSCGREAHYGQGSLLSIMGELTLAQEHLEHGLLLYDPQKHRAHTLLYGGQDPGVGCLSVAALNLWFLGYPDRALKRMHEALTLAREVSHPLSVAFALSFAAVLHQCRREGPFTAERAAEVRTLANEQGFALFGAWGMYMQGWALAEQGHGEEGQAQIQQGIATYRATGAELAWPYQLTLLADAYQRGKQAEAGLRVLTEALAVSDRTGEHLWAAELYRLKGELTLQQASNEPGAKSAEQESATPHPQGHILKPDAHGEAEAYFLNALTIARQQQAKSPELRAATSLARLWQHQGKHEEAHTLLSEVYTWFTEGFETKDLQEAKALLQELTCNKECG